MTGHDTGIIGHDHRNTQKREDDLQARLVRRVLGQNGWR